MRRTHSSSHEPQLSNNFQATEDVHSHENCKGLEMYLESLDLLKFYEGDSRRVNIAVRIVDGCSRPVDRAKVDMVVLLPEGVSFSMTKKTDSNGISIFEFDGVTSGRLNFGVTAIHHQAYRHKKRKLADNWRTTSI